MTVASPSSFVLSAPVNEPADTNDDVLNTPQVTRTSTAPCIAAVIEGRGSASEIGIASYNLDTCECTVTQIGDTSGYSRTLTIMHIHQPNQVVICSAGDVQHTSKLHLALEEEFEDRLVAWPRKLFSDVAGQLLVQSLCLSEMLASVSLALTKKGFALAAVGALFSFLERSAGISFVPQSILFRVTSTDGNILSIDFFSARNLELTSNARNSRSKQHLLGCIDFAQTRMGKRLLRMSLLQPLTDAKVIAVRQDCVQELLESGNPITDLLGGIGDLDQLISGIVQVPKIEAARDAEKRVQLLLALKQLLQLHALADALKQRRHRLFQLILQDIDSEPVQEVRRILQETLSEDIQLKKGIPLTREQRAYAIRAGVNTLMDVARKTFKETVDDIYEYASALHKHFGIPLQVKFKSPRGFYLSVTVAQLNGQPLPDVFCNVTGTTRLNCSTLDLLKLNQRIQESLNEVFLLSDQTSLDALQSVRARVGSLYKLSESLGTLDMLCSFAEHASRANCIRPMLSEDKTALKGGRHPILNDAVANDWFACPGHSFAIITGPNMSGKSTYLRQAALLTIMTQMGMFIPAEAAMVRVADAIFTRIGSDDDLESNASTFFVEMKEMAHAIQSFSPRSLLIIDELGRGTGTIDGMSLTTAICESLAQTDAFVLLATHFVQATGYLQSLPRVHVMNLEVHEGSHGRLSFQYRIATGQTSIADYGVKMAQQLGFPEEALSWSREAMQAIKSAQGSDDRLVAVRRVSEKRKCLLAMAARVQAVVEQSQLPREERLALLGGLREELQGQLDAL